MAPARKKRQCPQKLKSEMPPERKKRSRFQSDDDGTNGPADLLLDLGEISDHTYQEVVIKQEVDAGNGNGNGSLGDSDQPENETDNHDLNPSSSLCPSDSSDKLVKSIVESWPIEQSWKDRLMQGNRTIEDISGLLKGIAFTVWHPIPFLQLPIVQKGKVTSIIFKNSFPIKHTLQLIKVIGNAIEKVEFSFEDKSCDDQQRQLFVLILQNCKNLRELVIHSSRDYSPDFLSQPAEKIGFAGNLVDTNKIITLPPVDTIRSFSVNLAGFNDNCANGLKEVLLMLPKLEEIKLLHCRRPEADFYPTILVMMCEYIKKYKSDIHLKKLAFAVNFQSDSFHDKLRLELFVSLLILCGKHGIVFTINTLSGGPNINININKFLGLKNSHIMLLQENSPLSGNISGELTFIDQPLRNLNRLHSLNIRKWELIVKRSIGKEDVSWIRTVKELEFLKLTYGPGIKNASLQPSIAELEIILSEGFSTIADVRLEHNILDPIRAFRWSLYFPNLKKLKLSFYKTTPANLISQLTSLECLTALIFTSVSCLDDNSFTTEQVNIFTANNGAPELAPAITCFKSLKELEMSYCKKLTDVCLINGIAKCKTLQSLSILKCGSIREESHKFVVQCKRISIH